MQDWLHANCAVELPLCRTTVAWSPPATPGYGVCADILLRSRCRPDRCRPEGNQARAFITVLAAKAPVKKDPKHSHTVSHSPTDLLWTVHTRTLRNNSSSG